MNTKIKFEAIENQQSVPLPSFDIEILDDDDLMEKEILIGLSVELGGKIYMVVNQVVIINDDKNIIYYVEKAE